MIEWREFRGTTRTGATKVWKIRQDGEVYHIQHGRLGGKMQDTNDRPGPKGKEGSTSYMTAEANCEFNISRQIRKKEEKGYVEFVGGKAQLSEHSVKTADTVDFSKPLPKNFCPHKPLSETKLTAEKHMEIYKTGKARYTRKRDGECYIACHHTGDLGWRIYTRRMDDVTDKFPHHQVALMCCFDFMPGTILTGEMCVSRKDGTDDTIAFANFSRASVEKARGRVASGEVPEPVFYAIDLMFHAGQCLKEWTYDDRQALFKDVSLFNGENRYVKRVEHLRGVSPRNWEDVIKRHQWEGLVLVQGDQVAGEKLYTFNGNSARPKNTFKLKIAITEDVVVYAALRGKGANRETVGSFFVKQRLPSGAWFNCSKVGSGLTKDGGELDRDRMLELCRNTGVPFIDSEKDPFMAEYLKGGGFVLEVKAAERQPGTNFFKFPKIVRIRDDKKQEECFAQVLK